MKLRTVVAVLVPFLVLAMPGLAEAKSKKCKGKDRSLSRCKGKGSDIKLKGPVRPDYNSPNGKVSFTLDRNKKGQPVKVTNLKFSRVRQVCRQVSPEGNLTVTYGPELSATVGEIRVTKNRYGWLFRTTRVFAGVPHEIFGTLDAPEFTEAFFRIDPVDKTTCAYRALFQTTEGGRKPVSKDMSARASSSGPPR